MFAYLKTLIAWRKFILICGISAAAISVVVSLLLPKWYTAGASLFPPETKSNLSPYAELLQNLQAPILGPTAAGSRPGTIYIDIMLSRRVGEKLIEEFGLKERYGINTVTETIDKLHSRTSFTLLENGLLKISFEDRDPEIAARITNRYVELLDIFNRESNISRASKTREFIEEQLVIHENKLSEAEDALRNFQADNKIIAPDEQTLTAIIDIVAELTSKAVDLEIELKVLEFYASDTSDEYIRKKKSYDEIVIQLSKFKIDSARSDDDIIRSYFPSLDNVPDVLLQYVRLLRDTSVEEQVYIMLVKEYEQARIEEAKDTPTVQILDTAIPPELRSRPQRKRIVIIGSVLGFAWGALFALFMGLWRGETSQKLTFMELSEPIRGDFNRIFRRKRQ